MGDRPFCRRPGEGQQAYDVESDSREAPFPATEFFDIPGKKDFDRMKLRPEKYMRHKE